MSDMIEWRTIPSYPEYEASSLGEVRRKGGNNAPLTPHYYKGNRNGRVMIRHNGEQHLTRVNALVAEAFYGTMPKGCEILYRNGDESDNSISNIFYGNLPYFLAEPFLKAGWRWVVGYEGLYIVSSSGEVRSMGRRVGPRIIQGSTLIQTEVRKYLTVTINKNGISRRVLVHRLVATAFIENPNNLPCINHKDEDKFNNNVSNLEWCTHAYNNTYGTRIQRIAESNGIAVAVYTKDDELIGEYYSIAEASRKLGYSSPAVGRYLRGERNCPKGYKIQIIN